MSDFLFGRRIVDGPGFVAASRPPFAVNQELHVPGWSCSAYHGLSRTQNCWIERRSGSKPRPGLSLNWAWPSLISESGPARCSRNGLSLELISRSPSPPAAARRWADATRPMPPPRKCGQKRRPASLMDSRNRQTSGEAAPFGQIRLQNAQGSAFDGIAERDFLLRCFHRLRSECLSCAKELAIPPTQRPHGAAPRASTARSHVVDRPCAARLESCHA